MQDIPFSEDDGFLTEAEIKSLEAMLSEQECNDRIDPLVSEAMSDAVMDSFEERLIRFRRIAIFPQARTLIEIATVYEEMVKEMDLTILCPSSSRKKDLNFISSLQAMLEGLDDYLFQSYGIKDLGLVHVNFDYLPTTVQCHRMEWTNPYDGGV